MERAIECLDIISKFDIVFVVNAKHMKTLELLFSQPASGSIRWSDIMPILLALGATISEGEGS